MSRVRVVAGREFLATVRRKSYLIVTFGMPFFATLYFGLFAFLPAFFMSKSGDDMDLGLVDEAGVVRPEEIDPAGAKGDRALEMARRLADRLPQEGTGRRAANAILEKAAAPMHFRLFPSREEAMAALLMETIARFYVIPSDYIATGAVMSFQPEQPSFDLAKARSRNVLAGILSRSLLSGRVPEGIQPRIETPIDRETSTTYLVKRDGSVGPLETTARIARMAIPGAFGILLLMSLMTSSGYLLQGVAEEKENRVIEVILSSVRPDQLLFGKLLGLGGAGLLQLVIWVAVASLATSVLAAAALAVLDARLFAGCLIFFVLGFLMIGSLMTGTGALGTNARESQQFAALWSIIAVLPPALTWIAILDEPNGWIARLFGWFPLSAPITMMLRLGTGEVPLWDVIVAILCLALGVYLGIRLAGALFRLGLLMYGKRPSLREIVRQLRH